MYPYSHNDLNLRSHDDFIAAAKEAEAKSTKKNAKSVDGVKGLSGLAAIMSFPQQIVLDYMHLVCLNHVGSLITCWIRLLDKETILKIDNLLFVTQVPHNIHVIYKESISNAGDWKAKHNRLFVLNIGVPIGWFFYIAEICQQQICFYLLIYSIILAVANLPRLYASHWVIYCIAIKLLHAPELPGDIDFAERLLNFYCRTITEVYDQCLEYYSLHAHLHLPAQVRLHGGLSFCSVR